MAFVMSFIIVAGFSLNIAMGRSSFAVRLAYHVHAVVFMAWIGIFLAQHVTASAGNWPLHAKLGKLAYLWVPLMVVFGTMVMVVVARRTGGPFFFHVSEFLWGNIMTLWCFGGLAWWALMRRRYTGWHRRPMLCAMAILTGPGLGRLLPLPLMIPQCLDDCRHGDDDLPGHRHGRSTSVHRAGCIPPIGGALAFMRASSCCRWRWPTARSALA